jgi:ABC-2 type transport system ATP-binding protein
MLSLRNFSKQYNGIPVLHLEDLSFGHGVHWIKGENGSGKSTLFKSLAGLLPYSGEIVLENFDLRKDPIKYRTLVNYSEAEPLFPGFLTAKDLIRFIGKTKSASQGQQEHLIQIFNVTPFLEKPCETYSSGMMKKLSLALAFLGNPKVIILDEPLITLDETTKNILFSLINETLSSAEVTFLISSHQLLENSQIQITNTFSVQQNTLVRV